MLFNSVFVTLGDRSKIWLFNIAKCIRLWAQDDVVDVVDWLS